MVFILIQISSYAQNKRYRFSEQKMGSPLTIIFYTQDSIVAQKQASQCFKLVDSLNHIFSNYDSSSELSVINQQAGKAKTYASPLMWELILLSKQAYEKSMGTYNIAMGPLTQIWRIARREKQFPSKTKIEAALLQCDFSHLEINEIDHSINLKKGMQIDFGGIGKGYIAQKIVQYLNSQGISECLVDAGGDMVLGNAPPQKKGWSIGVNQPEKTMDLLPQNLLLHNLSVATSGDVYQFIEHHQKKYSHIINPKTGYGITSLRNVTVIARDGALADWLATACSILPIMEAKKLAHSLQAELFITELLKGRTQTYYTSGFTKYWSAPLNQTNHQ